MSPTRSTIDPAFLSRLERLDLAIARIERGEMGGRRRSSRKGMGGEFLEHRAYSRGDDRRYIDWNVYGRLEQRVVKEFTAEERLHLALLVDASRSMDFGRHNKLARARELAACLGFIALSRGDRVSLVPLGNRNPSATSFQGKRQIAEFLSQALSIGPGDGSGALADAGKFLASLARRPVAVVFSDLFDLAREPELAVRLAARTERVSALHLVDPLEEDPLALGSSGLGRTRLVDLESSRAAVVAIDRDLVESYRARFRRHLAEVERAVRSRRIAYARISTADIPEEATLRAFRSAGLLR